MKKNSTFSICKKDNQKSCTYSFYKFLCILSKGTFLSEDTDVFVISQNRQTFYFPELEDLNLGDRKLLRNSEWNSSFQITVTEEVRPESAA